VLFEIIGTRALLHKIGTISRGAVVAVAIVAVVVVAAAVAVVVVVGGYGKVN
jgi:hypothetical protein